MSIMRAYCTYVFCKSDAFLSLFSFMVSGGNVFAFSQIVCLKDPAWINTSGPGREIGDGGEVGLLIGYILLFNHSSNI